MRVAGDDVVEAGGEIMSLQKLWRKVESRDIAKEEFLSFGQRPRKERAAMSGHADGVTHNSGELHSHGPQCE